MTEQTTHWVGCWREHHECAVALIDRLIDGAVADAVRELATLAHDKKGPGA